MGLEAENKTRRISEALSELDKARAEYRDVKRLLSQVHAVLENFGPNPDGTLLDRATSPRFLNAARRLNAALKEYLEVTQHRGDLRRRGTRRLTSQQQQVLKCAAVGMTNKEIAQQMGISIKTVEYHKRTIRERLGLHGAADLIRYALRAGYDLEAQPPAAGH